MDMQQWLMDHFFVLIFIQKIALGGLILSIFFKTLMHVLFEDVLNFTKIDVHLKQKTVLNELQTSKSVNN